MPTPCCHTCPSASYIFYLFLVFLSFRNPLLLSLVSFIFVFTDPQYGKSTTPLLLLYCILQTITLTMDSCTCNGNNSRMLISFWVVAYFVLWVNFVMPWVLFFFPIEKFFCAAYEASCACRHFLLVICIYVDTNFYLLVVATIRNTCHFFWTWHALQCVPLAIIFRLKMRLVKFLRQLHLWYSWFRTKIYK